MQTYRPTKKRILVFSVPFKHKREGSLLYMPKPQRGGISGVQEAWVIATGPECVTEFSAGQKVFVHDGFEFDRVNLDLWETLRHTPDFAKLNEYVMAVDGIVKVELVTESSVLAVEEMT